MSSRKKKKSAQYLFKNHSEIPLTFRPVKKRSNLMVFDHFDRNSSTLKTQFWIYEWSKSKYFWYFFKKKRFSDQPGEIKFSKYAPETDWNDTFERTVVRTTYFQNSFRGQSVKNRIVGIIWRFGGVFFQVAVLSWTNDFTIKT